MFAQPPSRVAAYPETFVCSANELEQHNGPVYQRVPGRFSDLLLVSDFSVGHPHTKLIRLLRRGSDTLILIPAVGTWRTLVIHRCATIAAPRDRGGFVMGMGQTAATDRQAVL